MLGFSFPFLCVSYLYFLHWNSIFFRDLRETIISAQKESKFYIAPYVKNACLGLISLYAKFH